MEMEDLLQKIDGTFNEVRKERCERCKYRLFAKRMDELHLSNDILEELKSELCEQHEYEKNKWTKILKPFFIYVLVPILTSGLSSCFVYLRKLYMRKIG